MRNLDELKLIIPDWNSIIIRYKENIEVTHSGGMKYNYPDYDLPEIEAKRFAARLVLLQIAEYLNVVESTLFGSSEGVKYIGIMYVREWLSENHPEILEWWFA